MPTQNIHEVINKIAIINPDLNVESLNNLLIASGWEKNDIDIGLHYFDNKIKEPEIITDILSGIEVSNQPENLPILKEDLLPIESDPNVLAIQSYNPIKNNINKHNLYIYVNVTLLILLILIMALYIFKFKL